MDSFSARSDWHVSRRHREGGKASSTKLRSRVHERSRTTNDTPVGVGRPDPLVVFMFIYIGGVNVNADCRDRSFLVLKIIRRHFCDRV